MRRLAIAATLGLLAAPPLLAATPPDEDFVVHCSGCHGQDGAGTPGVVPPLSGLAPFLGSRSGRDYLVRVPGVAQASLDDARLAALLNWVLAELSRAAPDPPYDAEEVGALRRAPLRDPRALRRRALDH